ncbi:MAG TPA: ABC transporter substrate-binding protein [Acidimicrobiales bacterium]|nr:ABC transporter substrate-binding protein [Acidimicrobiales bacterium]
MRSPKLFTRGLLIALAGVTALAACSSSKAKTAAAGGSATTAAPAGGGATGAAIPAASPDPAAQGQVPASLKSKGTLTVAMDATYAPDEFTAPDGHTIIGMDVDLMQAVGQVLGLKMSPVNATFNTIIPGLLSGKFDVGASSFTDTKDREKQLDFVTYFSSGEGFYVPANSSESFDGLDSLCGHKVSVESGTTEETDANSQKQTCGTEGKPTVTVLSFQDQNSANLAVSSGRAEAGFSDSQVAAYIVQQSNGQFKLSGQPFATAPYGIGVPKNGLAPALLAAIKDLMSSGIYTKILDKWGIASGAITTPVINGATS